MWEAIADFSTRDHDAADAVYRRWARDRMRSRRFAGFIVEVGAESVASGCVWIMDVQPRPGRSGTAAAYLLSMFTESDHRGEGHATRIVRAARSDWSAHGEGSGAAGLVVPPRRRHLEKGLLARSGRHVAPRRRVRRPSG